MTPCLTLIGFGEAAQTFAAAAGWGAAVRAFDIKPDVARFAAAGITECKTAGEAIAGASQIVSLVTADQALSAARDAARHIAPGAMFFDMNSVAPETKCNAAAVITAAGGAYVDVAVMSPVNPARLAVPLLLSGPCAEDGVLALIALGFTNVRVVGNEVGRASSIKMIRSVMIKGQEALTAEMMLAADKADVVDEVLASLGDGWRDKAAYNLERMTTHGTRRAAEMEEVAKTLEALGVEPLMTRSTIIRQREMAA
jgi:3-hydroxyisobutyrate dehydrogenase-like beta-hydroxyacid dehydrogenase